MLFSDGAAALLLGPPTGDFPALRVRSHRFGSDGAGIGLFSADWRRHQHNARPHVCMNGPALFRFAVDAGIRTLTELCADANVAPACLKRVLIHQANARITSAVRDSFVIPGERWPETIGLGNLAGASLLFLLAEEFADRTPACGDLLALIAFGAGLTWAGSILEVGCW